MLYCFPNSCRDIIIIVQGVAKDFFYEQKTFFTAREMKSCRVTKKTESTTINAHVTAIIGYFYLTVGLVHLTNKLTLQRL